MKRIQHLTFALCLLATLANGSLLWLARLGWSGLIVLCVIDLRYTVYAAGFYMSFFRTSGFFENHFITLKHFQMALILIAGISLVRDGLKSFPFPRLEHLKSQTPLLLLFTLSIVIALIFRVPWIDFLFPLNILSLIGGSLFLAAFFTYHPESFRPFLLFFIGGTAYQIFGALIDLAFHKPIFGITILHDNHLGILCVMSIFYAFSATVNTKQLRLRVLLALATALIMGGLLLSCSRTAWISFAFGTLFFACFTKQLPVPESKKILSWVIGFLLAGFVMFSIAMMTCYTFSERITHLPQLFDMRYLKYTLEDKQNFGFLGIYRLNQLREFWKIFIQYPVFGIGFTKMITDYHGLFFGIISATGIVGAGLFFFYAFNAFSKLTAAFYDARVQPAEKIIIIATLSTLLSWLFTSTMETIVVHFFVWMTITLITLFSVSNRPTFFPDEK